METSAKKVFVIIQQYKNKRIGTKAQNANDLVLLLIITKWFLSL